MQACPNSSFFKKTSFYFLWNIVLILKDFNFYENILQIDIKRRKFKSKNRLYIFINQNK